MVASKNSITHDETISYLSAVGRQGAFERILRDNVYPANHWATVAEWQAWFSIETPFAFGQISRDLAESDIHPPLYFWLLHVWIWLFDVHPWTGPTLNMLLQAVGAWGLFRLAQTSLRHTQEALAVTFIWVMSPAVLTAVLEARQYTLLAVCTIFFVWMMVRIVNQPAGWAWQPWVLLLLATAAGALTHFHFVLVVAGAGLLFVLKLVRQDFKRVLYVGTAVAAGYLLSFALHPQFLLSVSELSRRQALEAKYLSGTLAVFQRIYAVGNTFTGFWTISQIAQLILFCLALASLIWLGMVLLKNPARVRQFTQNSDLSGLEMGLFFAWIGGISILLYLTFVSPVHAMTARHMSAVWPFFPFLPVLLLRTFPAPKRYWAVWGVGTAVFLSAAVMTWQSHQPSSSPSPVPFTGQHVVVDGVYQGILPRLFWDLPAEAYLFAATQEELLAEPDLWLPQLAANDLYISDLSYDNTLTNQEQILALLARRFAPEQLPGDTWSLGQRYFLRPQLALPD
ncbi:MAG: glycosyltransferase family 39 protein [Chloroflexota bacterium]